MRKVFLFFLLVVFLLSSVSMSVSAQVCDPNEEVEKSGPRIFGSLSGSVHLINTPDGLLIAIDREDFSYYPDEPRGFGSKRETRENQRRIIDGTIDEYFLFLKSSLPVNRYFFFADITYTEDSVSIETEGGRRVVFRTSSEDDFDLNTIGTGATGLAHYKNVGASIEEIMFPSNKDIIESRAECDAGGPGSLECTLTLPDGSSCSVTCGTGHYACCKVGGGCHCVEGSGRGR